MEKIPTIQECMTPLPHTIGVDIPLTKASTIMNERNIRHLPVLREGRLVGIISDRDIKVARSYRGTRPLTVGEVMSLEPYVVSAEAFLDEVVAEMIEHKYGSALVQATSGNVVGIFTTIDALRLLQNIFQKTHSRAA